jgi:hypothetical protein
MFSMAQNEMPQKRKAGLIRPAKSSQDPHSIGPLRVINRSAILCELKIDYQRFGTSLAATLQNNSFQYRTKLVLSVLNYHA